MLNELFPRFCLPSSQKYLEDIHHTAPYTVPHRTNENNDCTMHFAQRVADSGKDYEACKEAPEVDQLIEDIDHLDQELSQEWMEI